MTGGPPRSTHRLPRVTSSTPHPTDRRDPGRAARVHALAYGTQIDLDNHEPEYIQLHVTGGQVALDLRELPPSFTLESIPRTPHSPSTAPATIALDVDQGSSRLGVYRGGGATMAPAGRAATAIASGQQLAVTGTEPAQVAVGAAPQLTMSNSSNSQRTAYLIQAPTRAMSGPPCTERYRSITTNAGGWWRRTVPYGSGGRGAGPVPYGTGRWIWDPRCGWTWLDAAPGGWAPHHYGRWVFLGN